MPATEIYLHINTTPTQDNFPIPPHMQIHPGDQIPNRSLLLPIKRDHWRLSCSWGVAAFALPPIPIARGFDAQHFVVDDGTAYPNGSETSTGYALQTDRLPTSAIFHSTTTIRALYHDALIRGLHDPPMACSMHRVKPFTAERPDMRVTSHCACPVSSSR